MVAVAAGTVVRPSGCKPSHLRPRSAPYLWVRGLPASSTCSVFARPDGNVPTATAT